MNRPTHSQDDFGTVLAGAMKSRPLPQRVNGLADRAMTMARARAVSADTRSGFDTAQLDILARQQRRGMLVNALAAAVVIALLAGLLAQILPGSSSADSDPTTEIAQIDQNVSGSITTDSLMGIGVGEFVIVAAAVLVGTLLLLSIETSLSASEDGGGMHLLVGRTQSR